MNISYPTFPPVSTELFLYFIEPWSSQHLKTRRLGDYSHVLEVSDAEVYPDELLEHYLTSKDFTCCVFSIGLEIVIGGKSWTNHNADHLWHIWNWFKVLERAKNNDKTQQSSSVWDESHLVLERNGEFLRLWDENVQRHRNGQGTDFAWSPVTIGFTDFYMQMQHCREQLFELCQDVLTAIKRQGYDPDTLRARVESLGDEPHPEDDDRELKCAIIAREIMGDL